MFVGKYILLPFDENDPIVMISREPQNICVTTESHTRSAHIPDKQELEAEWKAICEHYLRTDDGPGWYNVTIQLQHADAEPTLLTQRLWLEFKGDAEAVVNAMPSNMEARAVLQRVERVFGTAPVSE